MLDQFITYFIYFDISIISLLHYVRYKQLEYIFWNVFQTTKKMINIAVIYQEVLDYVSRKYVYYSSL